MFFILRPNTVPVVSSKSHCRPHRRHCNGRVKYRGGRFHHFQPYHPSTVLVDLNDVDNIGKWMPRRHCALKFIVPDGTMEGGTLTKALSCPIECPDSNTAVVQNATAAAAATTTTLPTNSEQNGVLDTSTATTKTTSSTDSATTGSSRHEKCGDDNIILERTPVHREEMEEFATISMDVSGFTLDQLQVRLEEEEDEIKGMKSGHGCGRGRPILTVHGERTNLLGDKFKIHRRFLLDRDNLADGNLQELAISANLTKEGILTIRVPKKRKGTTEKETPKVSRTIPVQQQIPPSPPTDSNSREQQSTETTTNNDEIKPST